MKKAVKAAEEKAEAMGTEEIEETAEMTDDSFEGAEVMTKHIRVTFIAEVLGSASADPEIQRKYISSKAPDAATLEDEIAASSADEVADSKMTVFYYVNPETELPFTADELARPHYPGIAVQKSHQMRGYFGDAAKNLYKQQNTLTSQVKAYKTVLNGAVRILPEWYPYCTKDGSYITRKDVGRCERSLKAETMQGPRIALAASESIPAGTQVEFWIRLRPQIKGPDIWTVVQEWLNYGEENGFGQWHSSGRGCFVWELLDDAGNVIGGNKAAWKKKEKPWQAGLDPKLLGAVMALGKEGAAD